MIKSAKITAVNMPHGTVTVMWNNDPEMEWNYFIPMGEDGLPLVGDEMMRALVAAAYEYVVELCKQREVDKRRESANFDAHNDLLSKSFNLEAMVGEYEEARTAIIEMGSLPPSEAL